MRLIFRSHVARELVCELVENAVNIAVAGFVILLLIMAASGAAHAACLWDANDKRLYCSFDEPRPGPEATWAIPCGPTLEPVRSDTGTVYCGHASTASGKVTDVSQAFGARQAEMNLDCEITSNQYFSIPATTSEEEKAMRRLKLKCRVVEGR